MNQAISLFKKMSIKIMLESRKDTDASSTLVLSDNFYACLNLIFLSYEIIYNLHFCIWPPKNSQNSQWWCGVSTVMWILPPPLLGPHIDGYRFFYVISGWGVAGFFSILSCSCFRRHSFLNSFRNLWDMEDTFPFLRPPTYDNAVGCQNLTSFNIIYD